MRVWCAQCKRAQEVMMRRRKAMEKLAGRIGVCAICHFPVSTIGTSLGTSEHRDEAPVFATVA